MNGQRRVHREHVERSPLVSPAACDGGDEPEQERDRQEAICHLHDDRLQRFLLDLVVVGAQKPAFFTGRGPHERDYKRGTALEFEKGTEPRYIELRIKDKLAKLQPEFEVKVWK